MKTYTKQDIINAMKKLHPCPFCGTVPKIIITDDEGNPRNTDYLNDTWSGIAFGIRHDVVKECPISFDSEDDADCIPMGNRLYDTPDVLVETWNSAIQNTKERTSEGKLTKERHLALIKEKDRVEELIIKRCKEIIRKAPEGIDVKVKPNGIICVEFIDEASINGNRTFHIEEETTFRGESETRYSIPFPIDALYSDEALDEYYSRLVKEKEEEECRKKAIEEKRKATQEKRERAQYERLKAKYGKSENK